MRELGLDAGAVVTSYAAVPGEPPTAEVNDALVRHGIRVLLPITLADLDLDWHDSVDLSGSRSGRAPSQPTSSSRRASRSTGPGRGWARAVGATTVPRRRAGVPVVVLLHPGELLGADEPPLPRRAHDQPVDAVLTADGLSTWPPRAPSA